MDTKDKINAFRSGDMSRRAFTAALSAASVSLVMTPLLSKRAGAEAADQATYFTWGGYDVPEFVKPYVDNYGEPPNFATFGGSEEALTKMRAGSYANGMLERLAEPFCSVRWVMGADYPAGLLRRAWRFLLDNAFHDVIYGGHVDGAT